MRYVLKKLCILIITLFIVSLLAFLAFQVIPGDPSTELLGTEATAEARAELRRELGLDRMVTDRLPLSDIEKALNMMLNGENICKIVINCEK